jgi:hypothetical protein
VRSDVSVYGTAKFRFAMVRSLRRGCVAALVLFALAPMVTHAQTTLGTQTLSLTLQADGLLYGFPSSLTLTKTGTVFDSYTGSIQIQYKSRTSNAGAGAVTLKATTDFTCVSGGPCITTPPTAGDALTYTCTGATLGSSCTGAQTVSTTSSTSVVSGIPAGACTGSATGCNGTDASGNTVTVNFTLTDDPKYKTGSYSTTLTFTISST